MISKQEALDEDEGLKPSFVRNKVRKNASSAVSHLDWMKWPYTILKLFEIYRQSLFF